MRTFGASAAFFGLAAAVYGLSTTEAAGTVLLVCMCATSAIVAGVLAARLRSVERTEARVNDALSVAALAHEAGALPSDSAVPMIVSVACSIVAVGLIVGVALLVVGFVAFACSLMFVFRQSL